MKRIAILSFSVLGFSVITVQADTLRMRDGQVITGTFDGADRNEIRFRPDGQDLRRFNVSNVDSLSFDSSSYNAPSSTLNTGSNGSDGYYRRDPGSYNTNNPRNTDRNQTYSNSQSSDPNGNYRGGAPPPNYNGGSDPNYAPNRQSGYADRAANGQTYSNPGSLAGLVIPAGTVVSVRTIDAVDSDSTSVGQTYQGTLDRPIVVDGQVVAPAGSNATIQVVRLQQGGHFTGREEVAVALASFTVNGQTYNLNTNNETVSSNSRGRQSGEVIGGGAALGAIIGGIAGGGGGAAIGAASGAAIGAGAQVVRGARVRIPSETRLNFTLTQDVHF